jgi:hypothetical protein
MFGKASKKMMHIYLGKKERLLERERSYLGAGLKDTVK